MLNHRELRLVCWRERLFFPVSGLKRQIDMCLFAQCLRGFQVYAEILMRKRLFHAESPRIATRLLAGTLVFPGIRAQKTNRYVSIRPVFAGLSSVCRGFDVKKIISC